MGKSSREKGKRGELELAHELRNLGFPGVRRGQQYCGAETSADILGLPGVHIECKRTEALSLYTAFKQAAADSADADMPVVIHRRSHQPWLVIMSLEDWSKMFHIYIKNQ